MRDLFDLMGWTPGEARGEIVIDSFAGAGGASLGIRAALGRDPDVAVNHDPVAVTIHRANHPETLHFCKSVWEVTPQELGLGRPVGLLWASPDCKHFSKAKGGKPLSQNIRDLAWVIVRYAEHLFPRVIIMENVEEFQDWGPLDPQTGRPIPGRKGETFREWLARLRHLRYRVQWRELRACDHGAPTIRKRLFIVARRDGRPIVWPRPTHGDPKSVEVKSGKLAPWRTAAECIDWNDPAPSIFERKRALAENTLRRIAKGVERYVVNADRPFLVKTCHAYRHFRGQPINEPLRSITKQPGFALTCPVLVGPGGREGQCPPMAPNRPMRTVTAKGDKALLCPVLVGAGGPAYSGKPVRVDMPAGTLLAENHRAMCSAVLVQYNGCSEAHPLDEPANSATSRERLGFCPVCLIPRYGERDGQKPRTRDLRAPMPVVVPTGNGGGLCAASVVKMRGNRANLAPGSPANRPLDTISAGGLHHGVQAAHLLKYYGTACGQPLAAPAHTVTGKHRFGLVSSRSDGGHATEVRALLLRFRREERSGKDAKGPRLDWFDELLRDGFVGRVMVGGVEHMIDDIGLRMLRPRELARAQGFPDGYILDPVKPSGKRVTATEQVRGVGNSVCPPLAQALVAANVPELCGAEAAA